MTNGVTENIRGEEFIWHNGLKYLYTAYRVRLTSSDAMVSAKSNAFFLFRAH